MRHIALSLLCALVTLPTVAQTDNSIDSDTYGRNGMFNHFAAAFTMGTTGLGFDFAAPVTDWLRLRAGGTFRLRTHQRATLTAEVAEGLTETEQSRRFENLSSMMVGLMGTSLERTIEIDGTMRMHHFKLLVDVFPFKNNRHWHVTAGFYYGNDKLVTCANTIKSVPTLSTVSTYNMLYSLAQEGLFVDMSAAGLELSDDVEQALVSKLQEYGTAANADGSTYLAEYGISYNGGTYAHDIIARQDIYDAAGNLVIHKGEVVRSEGETVRLTPDKIDMICPTVKVNRFKPYLGVGYDCAISRDKRTRIGIDAGVLFWGGSPKVEVDVPMGFDESGSTVYQTIDLVRDASNVPGSLGDKVKLAKDYKVYPDISLRISQRIW